jgi:gamma-glutamyltranspeptidase/glutathione hydrolase
MQVLYRLLLQDKSLIEAITEPKLHAEAETLLADEDLCETAASLAKKLGLSYQNSPGRDTSMGVVQAIQLDDGNMVTAIGDPRARGEGLVI